MNMTGMRSTVFRMRALAGVAVGILSVSLMEACAAARHPTQTAAPPAIVVMGLPTTPESTMTLTKRALGEIGGTLQQVQWHPTSAVLSTRYTRNRRGAGMTEVAVVATVARTVADSNMPLTLVELRAWAMDSMAVRRSPGDQIERSDTRVHRPRPITFEDVDDWESVEVVMRLLSQHGARRVR